jgi:Sec-independent protein secretion pathway component TatC
MMGPLMALYEIGILLSKLVERGRARHAAEDALAEAQ